MTQINHFNVEDGLSNRFIYSTLKDHKGFLWLGTRSGLNKFDGYNFQPYDIATKYSIDLKIDQLFEDDQGLIWAHYRVNTRTHALQVFNPITTKANFIEDYFPKLPFKSTTVTAIYQAADRQLYFALEDGRVFRYSKQAFKLVYTFKDNIREIQVHDGLLIASTFYEIYFIDLANGTVVWKSKRELSRLIGVDSKQQLWWYALDTFKSDNSPVIYYSPLDTPQPQVFNIKGLEDYEIMHDFLVRRKMALDSKQQRLWIDGKTTLYTIDIVKKQLIHSIPKQSEDRSSNITRIKKVLSLSLDEENDITWVGTSDGLIQLTLRRSFFKNYLPEISIRGIFQLNDSTLLANTYQKRKVVNLHTKTSTTYPNLLDGLGMNFSEDSSRVLWSSASKSIIESFNPVTWESKYYYYKENESHKSSDPIVEELFSSIGSNVILVDQQQKVWLGTTYGLYYLDTSANHFTAFNKFNDFPVFENANVYALHENQNQIWAGTDLGLFLIDKQKGVVAQWAQDIPKKPLPNNFIEYIHQENETTLWLATRQGGIVRLDLSDNSYRQFTTQEGLSHNNTYAIIPDEEGYLWISSDYGLMRFHPKSFEIKTFLPQDGIPHEEFNRSSYYKAKDGTMYFGGLNGITSFNPSHVLKRDRRDIPFVITSLQQMDGRLGQLQDKLLDFSHPPKITLAPQDKFFIVYFALLDFQPQQHQYAYKIEGLDPDWVIQSEPYIRINGLKGGQYTLRIKAKQLDGSWQENEIALSIMVQVPFYQTSLFWLLLMLALIAGIWGYSRWRLIRLQRSKLRLEQEVQKRTHQIEQDKETIAQQAKALKELDELKSQFFANISHELRTPLTLILSPIRSIRPKDYEEHPEKIRQIVQLVKENGESLHQLIEEILELTKLDTQKLKLEKKETALFEFLTAICQKFQPSMEEKELEFQFSINIHKNFHARIDPVKVEKILNNLLSNAIKYSHSGGAVTLQASWQRKRLLITIQDQGIGIPTAELPLIFERFRQASNSQQAQAEGLGIGLALASELAELMDGKLWAESVQGEGSSFHLQLPLTAIEKQELTTPLALEEILATNERLQKLTEGHFSKTTILLVEDHQQLRNYIKNLLQPYFQVIEAQDGETALALFKEHKVELVISDLMMPRMDGIELVQQLKKQHPQALPCILLTARTDQHSRINALAIGVDDYMTKPFSETELLIRILNLLESALERQQIKEDPDHEEMEEETISAWLEEINVILKRELDNPKFKVVDLAFEMHLSERQLHRKIKAQTGLTPNKYFREIRLLKAAELLQKRQYETLAEVAYAVGFVNATHFSRLFYDRFGKKPME